MPKPHIPLEQIRAEVEACRKCPLADGRTQTVFGVGNPAARVLIVGEAPGKNEDLQGEPFVGAAGKFLNELLAVAGLCREDVFIANVLKCRPPGNRDPRPEEIETLHALPAGADAHHRPGIHRDVGELLDEVHPQDRSGHHPPARNAAEKPAASRCSPSSTQPPRSMTAASGRPWRTTSPRSASCCGKATPRRALRPTRPRQGLRQQRPPPRQLSRQGLRQPARCLSPRPRLLAACPPPWPASRPNPPSTSLACFDSRGAAQWFGRDWESCCPIVTLARELRSLVQR